MQTDQWHLRRKHNHENRDVERNVKMSTTSSSHNQQIARSEERRRDDEQTERWNCRRHSEDDHQQGCACVSALKQAWSVGESTLGLWLTSNPFGFMPQLGVLALFGIATIGALYGLCREVVCLARERVSVSMEVQRRLSPRLMAWPAVSASWLLWLWLLSPLWLAICTRFNRVAL